MAAIYCVLCGKFVGQFEHSCDRRAEREDTCFACGTGHLERYGLSGDDVRCDNPDCPYPHV